MRIFSQTLLLIALLLVAYHTSAQEVEMTGRCLDMKKQPIENVRIYCDKCTETVSYSNERGEYVLIAPQDDSVHVVFRIDDYEEERRFETAGRRTMRLREVVFSFQQEEIIDVNSQVNDPFVVPKLSTVDVRNLPRTQVEYLIALTTAAVSNNELSSNYNVRGGNYDENLVYVNGFLINRPFLTRSGQQEGLSFINSALVQDVRFSAGGFDAQYGDKLSSVLDITYRTPKTFHGSLMASLLGVEGHVEGTSGSRFNYMVGLRYRANGYLLNSLPAKGAYNPVFYDGQALLNYDITEKLLWSTIIHFSSNNYRFQPQTQQTDFGTANEAYRFNVYFEGQEQTRFQTGTVGTALKYKPSERVNLDFYGSVFRTDEREYFDILGQYYINELETDPSKEQYGDSIGVLGIGSYLNHARNRLQASLYSIYHNGRWTIVDKRFNRDSSGIISHDLLWGVKFRYDDINDVLSEWTYIDSAGYSVPQDVNDKVELFETIKSKTHLINQRYTGFLQLNSMWSKGKKNYVAEVKRRRTVNGEKETETYYDTVPVSYGRLALSTGVRFGYTSFNNEFYVTPRIALTYFPRKYLEQDGKIKRRDVRYRFATGLYYQPPLYREFRYFDGTIHPDVQAQKSLHVVGGMDYFFNMKNRDEPFKFSAEAYYKYMWDVNTYEIINVRTRYYANNDVVAYAAGLDFNLHGQFVKGVESFFKIGFLTTKENVLGDYYYDYYNAEGEKIIFGYSDDQTVTDSVRVNPGYIPRPTDQLLNIGVLFQDRMPGFESFSAQLGLQFNSALPYGPPDFVRYKDTLRLKSYFRVDLGLSYDLLYKSQRGLKEPGKFAKRFSSAVISFEVFNLLGINNILSKQWIQDVEGKYYAIPNYLTQRRFNLKLLVRF